MEQQAGGTERSRGEGTPHTEGRLVTENTGIPGQSGVSGVSDRRRAELERLEAEAETIEQADDQGVAPRRQPGDGEFGLTHYPGSDLHDPSSNHPDVGRR